MIRRMFDKLQVFFYLAGFPRLAAFLGRFGTPPLPASDNEDDRITLPDIEIDIEIDTSELEGRAGPGWSLDEPPPEPLRIINFDPTFNNPDPRIDPARDLAFPSSKLDVN
jgi:hypothetical protein